MIFLQHHFLVHYGQAIRLFGPPRSFWTARFESKHRISKNIAEAAKNFKNISYPVAVRQQMRQASIIYRGMFEVQPFILPEKMFTVQDLDVNCQDSVLIRLRDFMSTSSFYCYDIEYKSQRYVRGDLVVLKVISEVVMFSWLSIDLLH